MLPLALVRQSQGREGAAIERLRAPLASRSPVVPVSDSASGLFPFPEMARHDFSYLPLFVARLPFSVYTTDPRLLPGVPKRATNKSNRPPYPMLLPTAIEPPNAGCGTLGCTMIGLWLPRAIWPVESNRPEVRVTFTLDVDVHAFPFSVNASGLLFVALGVKSHEQATSNPKRNLLPLAGLLLAPIAPAHRRMVGMCCLNHGPGLQGVARLRRSAGGVFVFWHGVGLLFLIMLAVAPMYLQS